MRAAVAVAAMIVCCWARADETYVRIQFWSGSPAPLSTHKLDEQLSTYLTTGEHAYSLLAVSVSCKSKELKRQNDETNALGGAVEDLRLLIVVGCPGHSAGYYLRNAEQQLILSDGRKFRTLLLRGDGLVLKDSETPLLAGQVREVLSHAP